MPWNPLAGHSAWHGSGAPQRSMHGPGWEPSAQDGGRRGPGSPPLHLHFHSSAIPGAWVLPDHQSMVWCNQLVGKVSWEKGLKIYPEPRTFEMAV